VQFLQIYENRQHTIATKFAHRKINLWAGKFQNLGGILPLCFLLRLYKRRLIRTCPVFQKVARNALGKLLAFCFLIKTSIVL
jgi:hypothetical protein